MTKERLPLAEVVRLDKERRQAGSADDGQAGMPPQAPPPEGPPDDEVGGGGRKPSQATVLVGLAQDAELFHDTDGTGYATIGVGDHREVHPVRTKPFRVWLRGRYYAQEGKAPSSQGVQDAIEVLDAQAVYDGAERPVHVRVAEHESAIYLDLADARWRAVKITAEGWQVVDEPPVRCRRRAGMLPLPDPEPGGSLGRLREFANVTDDDWPLVLAWLVAAVRPRGPYAVLNLLGEQGNAKTTTSRVLRRLVDPNAADVRRLTRDERDLILAASNSRIVAFDNLSYLQPWQSDALASLATGSGFATRTLYENDEETIFAACRPVILNGIEDVAVRPDLLDRSLLVYLPQIGRRRPERAFWAAYERARPRLLGALLDAVACALRRYDDAALADPPRMADFALWACAAEPALGLAEGAFMAAYTRNRAAAQDLALEASPVGAAIRDHLALHGELTGTAGEIHDTLSSDERRRLKAWPQSGQAMVGALKRCAPALRAAGVTVGYGERDQRGRRLWTLALDRSRDMTAGTAGGAEARSPAGDETGTPSGTPALTPERSAGTEPADGKASGTPGTPGSRAATQSDPDFVPF